MVDSQQPKYVTTADGRQITYARWQYEQTVKQEKVLKNVNELITDEATNAVSAGANFSQQDFGGLLRAVVPNLLDKFGKVNATAAIQFYDEAQTQWLKTYGEAARSQASRGNVTRQASRNALARTQGAIAAAQGYSAQFVDTYDLVAKTDTVVNFAMKVRAKQGHAPSVAAMNNALTREVASYHRDTILFNSALDPNVNRVQRVAQASACEFCRLMALGSTNGTVRTSTYAVKFHSHCHCTIQPLFDGEEPVRPDYYDEFEKEYAEVYKGNSAKDTLAEWRGLRERKAAAGVKTKVDLPRLDEIFTHTGQDRDKTNAAFNQIFGGKTFGNLTVESNKSFAFAESKNENVIKFSGTIRDANGTFAGSVERKFARQANGTVTVEHEFLSLKSDYRGQGFSTAFSKFSEDYYRANGVSRIELTAGLDNGGYTWAKAGYEFDLRPNYVISRVQEKAEVLRTAARKEESLKQFEGQLTAEEATSLSARLTEIARRLEEDVVSSADYIKPAELANMDGPELFGKSFGRWLLDGTEWTGIKTL